METPPELLTWGVSWIDERVEESPSSEGAGRREKHRKQKAYLAELKDRSFKQSLKGLP